MKQKKTPTLEFKEGKFNTRTVTDKKKPPKGKKKGKKKGLGLKKFFTRNKLGDKIPCAAYD